MDMVNCASVNCGNAYMMEDIGDCAFFHCAECKQSTCVECRTLVHPGRTCEENKAVAGDADADLGSGVQKCPNPLCGARALKREDGADCDRLICLQCGEAFCANCSVPYDGLFGLRQTDNSAHERSCCHYRDPEQGKQPVHVLRKAEAKPKSKSRSPPPRAGIVLWTAIADDRDFVRCMPFCFLELWAALPQCRLQADISGEGSCCLRNTRSRVCKKTRQMLGEYCAGWEGKCHK